MSGPASARAHPCLAPRESAHRDRRAQARMVRAGDRERAEAGQRLSAHAAAGRLSMDELEQRLEAAQTAVWARDLLTLETDLPVLSRRPAASRRVPLAAITVLIAAMLASVLVGHPVAPLFIAAALVWAVPRRSARQRIVEAPLSRS